MQRLQPRPAAAPRRRRRGQGAAARSSRGCRCRPARASTGARSCCLGRRGAVGVRRLDALPAPLRRGHRPGRRGRRARAAGARLDLHGRRLGRAVGAGAGRGSQVPRTAPDARPRRRSGQDLQRGRHADVASVRRAVWPNCTKKARSPRSPRSATSRRTRATSPAATTGRSASSTRTRARAGWGATSTATGEPNNPLQGLSLDYSLAPALATETMPVAAVSSPADYTMWAEGLGEPVIGPALRDLRRAGRAGRPLARLRPGARRLLGHRASCSTRWRLRQVRGRNRQTTRRSPTPKSDIRRTARGARRDAPPGMPIKCASLNAVGSYDTHSDEAGHARPPTSARRSQRWSPSSATSNSAGWRTGC